MLERNNRGCCLASIDGGGPQAGGADLGFPAGETSVSIMSTIMIDFIVLWIGHPVAENSYEDPPPPARPKVHGRCHRRRLYRDDLGGPVGSTHRPILFRRRNRKNGLARTRRSLRHCLRISSSERARQRHERFCSVPGALPKLGKVELRPRGSARRLSSPQRIWSLPRVHPQRSHPEYG